jgi:ribose transport system substrate-binding protein
MCSGDRFENGCNVFPEGKVPPLFIDTALNGDLLSELNLAAVDSGKAMPGTTTQELPTLRSPSWPAALGRWP